MKNYGTAETDKQYQWTIGGRPEIEVVHPKSHIHCAASFSIYAFEAMKAELEKVEEVRFIFTSPTFVADKTKKEQQPQKKFALHQKYMLLKKRQEEHI